jgi:hypothetical protein
MARSFVSPGVFTNEIDASFLGAGVGAIGAALIGTAQKGPAFVPVTVTNNSEFEEFFGSLDSDHMLSYAARSYLRNSATASVVRVLGPSGRSVNGTPVTPGYTAESMWGIVGATGSDGVLQALLEITASADLVINDLDNDEFDIRIQDNGGGGFNPGISITASFLSSSENYVRKVLNTDPTKFAETGYYLREVYDYANFIHGRDASAPGHAVYISASYAITDFQTGFNSGSSPWVKSQLFGGSTEYNLFRIHTLGHGEAENGRFKISVSNIKTSAAPEVLEFGKFDVEVRLFDDTDTTKSVVESFPNLSLDPSDSNYICRVIGDRYLQWNESRGKMVESGDFNNKSKFIRVEMTTGSFPDSALPWGYRGLAKADLMSSSVIAMKDIPLVADLLDKNNEANDKKYWGMETGLSGSVKSRLSLLPLMTGSDADFSLSLVSGSQLGDLVYNTSNPTDSRKAPGDTTSATVLQTSHAKFTMPVAFGFDGWDRRTEEPLNNESELAATTQLGTQALRQGIDVISDPDFIDINLLAVPGIHSKFVVDYGMEAMRDRADAFYVADISGTTPTAVIQEVKGRGFDNNYAALYYPSIKVYDDINSQAQELPASVPAIGAIAFNDRVAYPWFAPAGLNRAGLGREVIGFDVLGVTDQLTQDERDDLYDARINPIARFPDVPQGVIWGQKTLQLRASALDRINVRRLLIRAKKLVASAVKFLVFEPANATTQTRFRQLVNPILADIQQKQGLEAFKVVMDETTNPPELIDRNTLAGKIFLIPTRTAEFISVDFIISPSGASFDE